MDLPDGLTADSGKTKRAPVVLDLLTHELPDAEIALRFTNRWELLVATILSAQTTDVKPSCRRRPRWPGPTPRTWSS